MHYLFDITILFKKMYIIRLLYNSHTRCPNKFRSVSNTSLGRELNREPKTITSRCSD
jgi:hypothetical protein